MAGGSTELVRGVLVAASAPVSPALAALARSSKNFRSDSGSLFAKLALEEFRSFENQQAVASAGLQAFDQGHHQLAKAAWATDRVSTLEVHGSGIATPPSDDGLEQLIAGGAAEPGAAHLPKPPRTLEQLPTLVALGAFAELGVVRNWLAAGGQVAAVARPGPRWQELVDYAKTTAGTLLVPTVHGASEPGLDIVANVAEISAWVSQLARTRKLVIGSFFYSPGSKHLAVQSAADAVIRVAAEQLGPEAVSFTWMGTPTDSTVVSAELADAALAAWSSRGAARKLRDASFAIAGQLKRPTPLRFTSSAGAKLALINTSVAMQGANYLAAKRAQRWRAYLLAHQGFRVIYQVLPPANTESVVGFSQLEVAYRATSEVGIATIDAALARELYTYLLAAQLIEPQQPLDATRPTLLHERTALHGRLWRLPYEPNTAWIAAWALGSLKRKPRS